MHGQVIVLLCGLQRRLADVALAKEHRDGAEVQESTARQHHQHDQEAAGLFRDQRGLPQLRPACMRCEVIVDVLALGGDLISQIPGIVPHAPDERGATSRLPGQAEEIQARLRRDATLMSRPAVLVENIKLYPAVVSNKSRRPDDGGDSRLRQIEH